jgi:hypothetical protein
VLIVAAAPMSPIAADTGPLNAPLGLLGIAREGPPRYAKFLLLGHSGPGHDAKTPKELLILQDLTNTTARKSLSEEPLQSRINSLACPAQRHSLGGLFAGILVFSRRESTGARRVSFLCLQREQSRSNDGLDTTTVSLSS